MRKILAALLVLLCLTGCGSGRMYTLSELEAYLRQALPDQLPMDTSGAGKQEDNEAESRYWLHQAVYHGLIHVHNHSMTNDEILGNLEAFGGTAATILVNMEHMPGTYDADTKLWTTEPHQPEENFFYVVHEPEISMELGEYGEITVTPIGYGIDTGLYTYDSTGQRMMPQNIYRNYRYLDVLRDKIRQNPEEYLTLTVKLLREPEGLICPGLVN